MKADNLILIIILASCVLLSSSCNSCRQKAKEVINKTGEAVGSGAAEAGKGIYNGVAKEFESTVDVSKELQNKGISIGKFEKTSDSSRSNYNVLHLYIITNLDFNNDISVKVYDHNNKEYGRSNAHIKGKKGEAQWIDFIFDRRTDFENNSRFILEQR